MKALKRLKLALSDLEKNPNHLTTSVQALRWQPFVTGQPRTTRALPALPLGRCTIKDSDATVTALIKSGLREHTARDLRGATVSVVSRHEFCAMVERNGVRFAVPFTVLN